MGKEEETNSQRIEKPILSIGGETHAQFIKLVVIVDCLY